MLRRDFILFYFILYLYFCYPRREAAFFSTDAEKRECVGVIQQNSNGDCSGSALLKPLKAVTPDTCNFFLKNRQHLACRSAMCQCTIKRHCVRHYISEFLLTVSAWPAGVLGQFFFTLKRHCVRHYISEFLLTVSAPWPTGGGRGEEEEEECCSSSAAAQASS